MLKVESHFDNNHLSLSSIEFSGVKREREIDAEKSVTFCFGSNEPMEKSFKWHYVSEARLLERAV